MITQENVKKLSNTLSELFDFTYKLTLALDKENAYTEEQAEQFNQIKQRIWLVQRNLTEKPQE